MSRIAALFGRRQGATCATCGHFEGDPVRIEAMLPGLTVMGSAHASVAGDDGLCRRHDVYQSRHTGCADHSALA